jgi:hypothetical protein
MSVMTKLIFVADPGSPPDEALERVWNNLSAAPGGARLVKVSTTAQLRDQLKAAYLAGGKVPIESVMIIGHGMPGVLGLARATAEPKRLIAYNAKNTNVCSGLRRVMAAKGRVELVACNVAADDDTTDLVIEGQQLLTQLAVRAKIVARGTLCGVPVGAVTAAGATGIALVAAEPPVAPGALARITGDTSPGACAGLDLSGPILALGEGAHAALRRHFAEAEALVWTGDPAPRVMDFSHTLFAARRWRTVRPRRGSSATLMLFSSGARFYCALRYGPGSLPTVEVRPEALARLYELLPESIPGVPMRFPSGLDGGVPLHRRPEPAQAAGAHLVVPIEPVEAELTGSVLAGSVLAGPLLQDGEVLLD